jgi:hypothetical protein
MSEKVIRIEVTVEPRVYEPTTYVVEVPVGELAGKNKPEIDAILQGYAESCANEVLPWGWEVLPGEHEAEEP